MEYCAHDPSLIADGYCPELRIYLSRYSYDSLREEYPSTLQNIRLVTQGEEEGKDRHGEQYTMFDVVLDRPVSTVEKLVGESRENEVISLEEAYENKRSELLKFMERRRSQLTSMRVAVQQARELENSLRDSYLKTRQEIEKFFSHLVERAGSLRNELMKQTDEIFEERVEPIRLLGEGVPELAFRGEEELRQAQRLSLEEDSLQFLLDLRKDKLNMNEILQEHLRLYNFDVCRKDFAFRGVHNYFDARIDEVVDNYNLRCFVDRLQKALDGADSSDESEFELMTTVQQENRRVRISLQFDPTFSTPHLEFDKLRIQVKTRQPREDGFAVLELPLFPDSDIQFRIDEMTTQRGSPCVGVSSLRNNFLENGIYINLTEFELFSEGRFIEKRKSTPLQVGDFILIKFQNQRIVFSFLDIEFSVAFFDEFVYPFVNCSGFLVSVSTN